ncbi:MAG: 2Fe-2S iron-sulfur cluster-binding protein [Candidatus Dormibacteraceae bacterium]
MSEQPAETVTLTVDGRSVTVARGTLVVEAAKALGIEIPVFCYHHKMDPVGACRMCLVEIQPGPPRPQTGCTVPVAPGMVVSTQSEMAVRARADILEMELVNHPLDCPVCDKGGECPLQDYTFRHAYPVSRINDARLHFQKPIPLSETIALDRERCVLCYRCTRYYDEIAWEQELTADHRGVRSYITSQFDQPLTSIFSGNIIDLCPVGALTSRVWRFESRPWDMAGAASVCSRCSVGCNVTLWERRGQLVRVTSRENDQIDDGWICDRGRFEYTEVNDVARLEMPLVGGRPSTWEGALEAIVDGLSEMRGAQLGVHLAQDITNEEAFLAARLLEGPWRGARVAMEGRTALPLNELPQLRIAELDECRTIVVIASDTRREVPIVNLRLKKAFGKRGARLILVHPGETDLDRRPGVEHIRNRPGQAGAAVRKLIRSPGLGAGPVGILYGDGGGTEDVTELTASVADLAAATGAAVMPLYRGTNERGALEIGIAAGSGDLEGVTGLVCWGRPPAAIPESVRFLAVCDILLRPQHRRGDREPDVVLPGISFAETQGSYTNLEGRIQFLHPPLAVRPPRREGWEVLSELLANLGLPPDDAGISDLQRRIAAEIPRLAAIAVPEPEPAPPAVLMGPARP